MERNRMTAPQSDAARFHPTQSHLTPEYMNGYHGRITPSIFPWKWKKTKSGACRTAPRSGRAFPSSQAQITPRRRGPSRWKPHYCEGSNQKNGSTPRDPKHEQTWNLCPLNIKNLVYDPKTSFFFLFSLPDCSGPSVIIQFFRDFGILGFIFGSAWVI